MSESGSLSYSASKSYALYQTHGIYLKLVDSGLKLGELEHYPLDQYILGKLMNVGIRFIGIYKRPLDFIGSSLIPQARHHTLMLVTNHEEKREGWFHSGIKISCITFDYMDDSSVYTGLVKLKGDSVYDAKKSAENFFGTIRFKKFSEYTGRATVGDFLNFIAKYDKEYRLTKNNCKDFCDEMWRAAF